MSLIKGYTSTTIENRKELTWSFDHTESRFDRKKYIDAEVIVQLALTIQKPQTFNATSMDINSTLIKTIGQFSYHLEMFINHPLVGQKNCVF